MFVAGVINGDGAVRFDKVAHIEITACKNYSNRKGILDTLRKIITKRLGIIDNIYPLKSVNTLRFSGENTVNC
jgi:hypothetical protein